MRQSIGEHVLQGKRQRQNHQLVVRQRRHSRLGRIKEERPCRSARSITVTYKARLNGNVVIGSPRNRPTPSTLNTPTIQTHGRTTTTSPNEVKVCTGEIALRASDAKTKSSPARNSPSPKAPATNVLETRGPAQRHYRLATSGDTNDNQHIRCLAKPKSRTQRRIHHHRNTG